MIPLSLDLHQMLFSINSRTPILGMWSYLSTGWGDSVSIFWQGEYLMCFWCLCVLPMYLYTYILHYHFRTYKENKPYSVPVAHNVLAKVLYSELFFSLTGFPLWRQEDLFYLVILPLDVGWIEFLPFPKALTQCP